MIFGRLEVLQAKTSDAECDILRLLAVANRGIVIGYYYY
jgi:hypothetical protein